MGKGTVYFFTGLAGAGKTTIGGLFYQRLKVIRPDAILIDGYQWICPMTNRSTPIS